MNERYYVEKILPAYINAVNTFQAKAIPKPYMLQEDGDPSHGMRSQGLAFQLKRRSLVQNLSHPAQSPGLSPIEACWNILKQRVR